MYSTIKKLSLTFVFLNVFMFQSLMADMMFYYNAAILPSIIASKQQAPVAPTAEADFAQPQAIEYVSIDVLANDTIPDGSTVTILLEEYQDMYSDGIQRNEGLWLVDGNTVTFTPNPDFAGGQVDIRYQIIDQHGNTSENDIIILYPVFVQAISDFLQPANIEPVTINVLDNDTIAEGSTVNVLLEVSGQNGYEYVTTIDAFDGTWNVEANQSITFTPNANFNGSTVYMQYQIMDQDGHKSTTWVDIEYPILLAAVYDYLEVNDTSIPTTIDVLANDVTTGGATVTSLLLGDFDYNTGLPVFTSQITTVEGTWAVVDNQVTFTPISGFGGGTVYMEYQIIDDAGHTATEYIIIEYPVFVQAEYDSVQTAIIEPVTINVLDNDIVAEGSTVSVMLEVYNENGMSYVTTVDAYDGIWTVEANQSITFTPNANFNGSTVYMQYQIMDQDGHKSTTGIDIVYPVFLYAKWDNVQSPFIEPVSVDVLANDTIADGVTLSSVLLVNYDYNTGMEEIGSTFVTSQGTWSVNANQVVFEPNTTFGGGYVNIQYRISDEEGHSSTNVVQIEYPVTATPICTVTKTELVDLDGVYNAVADNISFIAQDGRRRFGAELDSDSYLVSSDFFTMASVITTLNPLYFVWYEDANTSYETRAELDLTQVNMIDSNTTWNYQGERIENDRGFKTIRLEGEDGDYTLEPDDSLKLMIASSPVFNFKAVRTISASEINNILETAGISLTLDSGDTAQLNLTKSLENRYWWNDQSWESEVYGSLQEYITSKEYNSSSPYLSGGVLYREGAQASIVFAENSSGMSGTLVEVSYQDNTLLTDTAGTWSIVGITDEGNTYNALVLDPILCGYSKVLYKLDGNGHIIQGDEEEVLGEISAEFSFIDSLKEKLKTFFIDNAVLDVDPSTPASSVITDAMLTGKTFYVVNDRGDGTFDYEMITVISPSEIDLREILTDINGNVVYDSGVRLSYVLDNGRIRTNFGKTYSLISFDANQWNMIIDGDANSPYGTWLLDEPANFPQL